MSDDEIVDAIAITATEQAFLRDLLVNFRASAMEEPLHVRRLAEECRNSLLDKVGRPGA